MKDCCFRVILTLILIMGSTSESVAQEKKKTIWQGVLHLGDNPETYPKVTSGGLSFQVPFQTDAAKVTRLMVTVNDVQTQAGKGHIVEVIGHFEDQPNKGPAKEIVMDTFRIKAKIKEDTAYSFEFHPVKNLGKMVPAYYSVRIKVDTYILYSLWDDFVVKRIEIEQLDS